MTIHTRAGTVGRPIATATVTTAAAFMVSLDNLVVTTALPQIRHDLGADLPTLQWVVNAYTLVFASLLLTGAALGDRIGRKRTFLAGVAIFVVGSFGAAAAADVGTLLAARAVQGLGAAILMPLTLTLLSAAFRPEHRGRAMAVWGVSGGVAVSLGPVLGGVLTEYATWHWIFWINVPIGAVILFCGMNCLGESRGGAGRLDPVGTVTSSVGLFLLVLGVIEAERAGQVAAILIALGVAVMAWFVSWEARTEHPVFPLRLLKMPSFSAITLASALMYLGMFGAIFLLPQYLQDVLGGDPLTTGLRLLAWTTMILVAAPVAAALGAQFGDLRIAMIGLALQSVGLGYLAAVVSPSADFVALVPGMVAGGLGMGLFFGPAAACALNSVDRSEEGIASGVTNSVRELGGVFGVAALGTVFSAAGGYGSAATFVSGLRAALVCGAVIVAAATAVCLVPRMRDARSLTTES